MNSPKSDFDLGILIRRSLFFLVLMLLTLGNLFVMFRGLNSPQAMDQAQIAREIEQRRRPDVEALTGRYHAPLAWTKQARPLTCPLPDKAQLKRKLSS